MARALYKTYLIVSAPDYNRDTQEWKPWVSVCLPDDGRQHLHQIRFTHEKFKNAQEAETFGVNVGEVWVDAWLRLASK